LEKKQFHNILTNYTALTREEAELLVLLEKEFPYSQVIRALAARATQDNQSPEKEDQLHLTAIYTTDRGVFKSIMTAPAEARKESHTIEIKEDLPSDPIPSSAISQGERINEQETNTEIDFTYETTSYSSSQSLIDDSFYEEVQHDLERLKELKHQFEETVKQLEDGTFDAEAEKKKRKPIDPTDELLTEIKSSKKKIKPESVKQKEQIEIIDQFIKTQPNIAKGKVAKESKEIPNDDLSEKNLVYNENIISETLVEILLKQGKKDKAIDVLRKLIWKFPQKKAYFAAQIEDLKK